MDSIAKKMIKSQMDKGINQIDLANRIGISQSTIQKILYTNTQQKVATLRKIATYFNIPISELLIDNTGSIDATFPALQMQGSGGPALILPPDPYIIKMYSLMQGKTDEEKEAMVKAAAEETSKARFQKKQKPA